MWKLKYFHLRHFQRFSFIKISHYCLHSKHVKFKTRTIGVRLTRHATPIYNETTFARTLTNAIYIHRAQISLIR